MAKNQVTLTFAGDTKSLENAFSKVGQQSGKVGVSLKSAFKIGGATAIATKGLDALTSAAKVGWDEFMNGQKVSAQTAATLKSTGGAAGVTQKHIEDLSSSLMKKTGADDDAIQSGQNLLLTFTNIKNEAGKGNQIFDQTTKAMLDLSQTMGQDTKTSAIQLGKALNDPVKGVSALSKVGVSFTQGQKDAIKAMMDSGNIMGAQKIILKELSKETGGAADAYGKTLPGQIDIAKNTLSNFAGNVVGKVVPVLAGLVNWVQQHWPEIQAVFQVVWDTVVTIVGGAIDWIKTNVVPAVSAVIDGLKTAWDRLSPIVTAAFDAVMGVIRPVLNQIKTTIELVMAIVSGDWGKVWDSLKGMVGNALDLVKGVISGAAKVLWAAVKALAQGAVDAFMAPFRTIYNAVKGVMDDIAGLFRSNNAAAQQWLQDLQGVMHKAGTFTVVPGSPIKVPVTHALGGVFTRPHLGMVAESGAEAIVPLTNPSRGAAVMRAAGLTGGGGGNTYNITVNAWDTKDGATHVVRAIDEFERRNGPRYARA